MSLELINKIEKMVAMTDKFSKIVSASSRVQEIFWASEEISKYSEALNRAKTTHAAIDRLNKSLMYYGGGQSFPLLPVNISAPNIPASGSFKLYGGGLPECLLPLHKIKSPKFIDFTHIDFLSNIHQQKIDLKRKSEAKIIDTIDSDYINFKSDLANKPINIIDFKFISSQKLIDYYHTLTLSLICDKEERITDLDWNNLRKIIEVLEIREEIKESQKFVKFLKSLKKSLCSVFRQFQINRRERFRKINSFLFKNLDDYHSLALTSVGY